MISLGFYVPTTLCHHESDGPATVIGLVGELQGYAVEISSNYLNGWFKSPFFIIRVFFNTDSLTTNELLVRREKNLAQSEHIRWSNEIKLFTTHIEEKLTISRNGPYSLKLILGIAEDLIAESKKLGLHPVSYNEGVNQWRINQD
ncbi:hypothetical protein A0257_08950 [Hymenobacter psoromatis]|nr:hypothetical protein A0257_08950 [Hymenobacter psoromatis]